MQLDERYGPPIAEGLTSMPDKAALYAADVDFQEGWEDLRAVAGNAARELAFTHSMMLVKPDAIVSRRLDAVLGWLPQHGFAVVACVPMSVNRGQVNTLWRYQFNSAPRLRRDAYQALFAAAPSVLLVVRSTRPSHVPAARRLTGLKGPADPARQGPHDLRACLGNVAHLLSFVHTADEPADLVRELAILLPAPQRAAIFARMRDRLEVSPDSLRAMAADACEGLPRHSLAMPDALGRIASLVQAGDAPHGADRAAAAALCARAKGGQPIDWRLLFDLLDRSAIRYDPWDRITIAAHLSDISHPDLRPLLPGIEPATPLSFAEIDPAHAPLDLLLLADPSETKVRAYLPASRCFAAVDDGAVVAACAVQPRGAGTHELMSIAVRPGSQKSGIGTALLEWVVDFYEKAGAARLEVGTGSFGYQLAFYQRQGFRVTAIDRDFFARNYPEPIVEEGIQLRDMLRLTREFGPQDRY